VIRARTYDDPQGAAFALDQSAHCPTVMVVSHMLLRRAFPFTLTLSLGACSSSEVASSDAPHLDASSADVSSDATVADESSDAGTTDRSDDSNDSADAALETLDAGSSGTPLWQVFYDRSFAAHVEVDSKGAAIVSGTIFKDKDIHVGTTLLSSHGAADIMLSRVLPEGKVDWARSYGAVADDYPVTFRLDKSDRIVLTGLYNGTGNIGGPDFPAFAGTAGRFDVSIAGLSATGDHRWSKTINTTADSFAGGIALDSAGNAFVLGQFIGTATINGAQRASAGSWDVFLARFDDPMGTIGASLQIGGTGDERSSTTLFSGTDVIAFGTFAGTLTMPTPVPKDLVSVGGRDIFVARISLDGKMTDATSFGGTGDEQLAGAVIDSNGNVVIAGSFSSPTLPIFGGDSLLNAGGNDIFVACLGSDLGFRWSKRFGGEADDLARDLAVGPGGVIGVGGEFRNHIVFDDRMHDASRADAGVSEIDAFVVKLSEEGTVLWSFAAGGPAPDRTLSVAFDPAGAIYAAITFQSPIDFGFGLLTPDAGQWASALVKLSP